MEAKETTDLALQGTAWVTSQRQNELCYNGTQSSKQCWAGEDNSKGTQLSN
eukprot:SAG31_NODE_3760_length_3909_cov_2.157743_3_plen_51_part_00